ncbi:hypothetical protein BY996DRAFT_7149493 [Phakopsora pachyrhizi]|nr:hypothetical protein BY996DRAFT_7149493 [Phakopsora pachyrhizi]
MFLKFFILCFIVINLLVVGMRLRASTHHRSDESLVDDDIRSSFLMFSRLIKFYPSEDRVDTLRTFHRSALNRRQESAVVPVTVTATVTVVSVLNFDQQPSSSTTQILTSVPVVSDLILVL